MQLYFCLPCHSGLTTSEHRGDRRQQPGGPCSVVHLDLGVSRRLCYTVILTATGSLCCIGMLSYFSLFSLVCTTLVGFGLDEWRQFCFRLCSQAPGFVQGTAQLSLWHLKHSHPSAGCKEWGGVVTSVLGIGPSLLPRKEPLPPSSIPIPVSPKLQLEVVDRPYDYECELRIKLHYFSRVFHLLHAKIPFLYNSCVWNLNLSPTDIQFIGPIPIIAS